MTTETRYIVRSDKDKRGKTCHSMETARWLAQDWKADGKRGVTIDEQTITTRRIYG